MTDVARERPAGFVETPEEIAFELRAHEGAVWTATRLLIGVFAFAFASLAFAYFYLRSSNNEDLWRPLGVTAPTGTGAAIMALTVFAALVAWFAVVRFRRGLLVDFQVAGWTAVLAGLCVAGLQIWQLTQLPFFPGSSGYASCFVGWAPMNVAIVLCATYWLETSLARELRLRTSRVVSGSGHDSAAPGPRLLRSGLDGCVLFFGFTAFVGAFFWLLFYVL